MTPRVSYIPSQLYGSAGSEPLQLRVSPFKLIAADLRHGFRQLIYAPAIFLPIRSAVRFPAGELELSNGNITSLLFHFFLFLFNFLLLIVGLALLFIAPGVLFLLYYTLTVALTVYLCRRLNYGPRILESAPSILAHRSTLPIQGEKWIFVNGICAGTHWLQSNLNLLSTIFCRPITGIHNRTSGILLDLVECLLQRDLSFFTTDVRITYNTLKTMLLSPDCTKLVLIAHSQGGIIISAALDALFAELPPECFDKLEIYTFGCAANHFSNPLRTPPFKRQIGYIEHYVNGRDFVGRIGVLRFVREDTDNLFVGKVFTREDEGGHMFNQHYLQMMFFGDGAERGFLDVVVEVEEGVAEERGAGSRRGPAGFEGILGGRRVGDEEMGREEGELQGNRAKGRTVRELSRLWRYRGGGDPGGAGKEDDEVEEGNVEQIVLGRRAGTF